MPKPQQHPVFSPDRDHGTVLIQGHEEHAAPRTDGLTWPPYRVSRGISHDSSLEHM